MKNRENGGHIDTEKVDSRELDRVAGGLPGIAVPGEPGVPYVTVPGDDSGDKPKDGGATGTW